MSTKENSEKISSKQAIKSANTQEIFLKAAIDCYVNLGYVLTTTTTVSQKAGLSRGAMVHHFPSKRVLVEASLNYLNEQRIKTFSRDMAKLAKSGEQKVGQDSLDIYWKLINSKYYTAYFELRMASRTDKELKSILQKADKDFEKNWMKNIESTFPEWCQKSSEALQLAMDVTQCLLEGMKLCNFNKDVKARQKVVIDFLKASIREIYENADNKED
jgi:AcrR family transcriptional regulator